MGLLDRVKASQAGIPGAPGAAPAGSTHPPAPSATPTGAAAGPPPLRTSVATMPRPAAPASPAGGGGLASRTASASADNLGGSLVAAKAQIHARLVERYADRIEVTDREGVREKVVELVDEHVKIKALPLTRSDRERLIESLLDDVLGLGPLEQLLNDGDISEIMINHPKQIYIERKGKLTLSGVHFESERQLRQVIDRIVSALGRRVDESSPMCDARLKDGSRVNVIIPPLALKGPCMTIRKFTKEKLGPDDLMRFGSATPDMLRFLEAAVHAHLNVLVSGGTGSGKTTLLNILSSFVGGDERIITCEDAAELQLQQEHVITLESRPPNVEGKGAVPIRELVKNCLRMRPDRVIVGECRGGEALDMLQAMNTGHDGSMSTLHANTPYDALSRLETLVLMAGADLPSRAIREQMASAVHLIVQQQRLRGGPRKVVSIAEVTGIENGEVGYQELFVFKQVGVDEQGRAIGYHTATGIRPKRREHFIASGEDLPDAMFEPVPEPPPDQLY